MHACMFWPSDWTVYFTADADAQCEGDDSTHGETTSWGHHSLTSEGPRVKLTMTTNIASRCKWRQLHPKGKISIMRQWAGGTTPDYPSSCRGDNYQSTVAEQGETILQ